MKWYKMIGLLFSRSRSQQGLIWSQYDSFNYSFLTADLFAARLSLIVHYHKQECCMEKLDCCVQGQGHSKILKCHWMFVHTISSESRNHLLPNLVWWCIIMSQIVFQKDWFAVFKVKVTVTDKIIKICLFNMLNIVLPNLVWWCITISQFVF